MAKTSIYTAEELSAAEYHSISGIGSTALRTFSMNPYRYYKEYVLGEKIFDEESDALLLGRAVHSLVLEPDTADETVKERPRKNSKEYKKLEEEGKIDDPNVTWLTSAQYKKAKRVAQAVWNNTYCSRLLKKQSRNEISVILKDDPQYPNLPVLKGRFDTVFASARGGRGAGDLKTQSKTTSPVVFERRFVDLHYHVQVGLYCYIHEKAYGELPGSFFIAVVYTGNGDDKDTAWIMELDRDDIELCVEEAKFYLKKLDEAHANNNWKNPYNKKIFRFSNLGRAVNNDRERNGYLWE